MKNLKKMFLVFSFTFFTSCAQQKIAEQKIDKEISSVIIDENKTRGDSTREYIVNSKDLSESTKTKLINLQKKSQLERNALNDEIEKTKTILIETVLAKKMNIREYRILKKKITKLEKKRIDNGFKALTEARNIINPKGNSDEFKFYKPYMQEQLY